MHVNIQQTLNLLQLQQTYSFACFWTFILGHTLFTYPVKLLCNCTLYGFQSYYTPSVRKVSVLIFYLSIYWTYLKLQVISFKV